MGGGVKAQVHGHFMRKRFSSQIFLPPYEITPYKYDKLSKKDMLRIMVVILEMVTQKYVRT